MSVSTQKNMPLRAGERGATAGAFHIEDVYPSVDAGRFPVKRLAGETIDVWADIFRSGHDIIAAQLIWRRDEDRDWQKSPMTLHDNDRWPMGPAEGDIEPALTAVAELQRQDLVRHIGVSNVTPAQVAAARRITPIVCVQNQYNLAHRQDDALIDALAADGIAYVPFFPLGGFSPLQSATLNDVAARLGATPMQVALSWLLHRSTNILLIPGTSSVTHLRENLAAVDLVLTPAVMTELDGIAAAA